LHVAGRAEQSSWSEDYADGVLVTFKTQHEARGR
jgi:hypothetical protein